MHFTKNRCWISKDDGERARQDPQWRSVLRGSQTFETVVEGSKHTVEQAALARVHAAFGTPGPAAGDTLDDDGEPTERIKVPTGPATPSAEERALHEASGHVAYRSW